MERFYNEDPDKEQKPLFGNGDDDDEEDDEEDDILEGEAVAFIDQQGIIDVMQMDLAQTELNQDLLGKAIDIAKQSWFWGFRSTEWQMNKIEEIYKRLLKLTDDQEDSDDSEDEEEDE